MSCIPMKIVVTVGVHTAKKYFGNQKTARQPISCEYTIKLKLHYCYISKEEVTVVHVHNGK